MKSPLKSIEIIKRGRVVRVTGVCFTAGQVGNIDLDAARHVSYL
jgi:hypothetical protein